MADLKQEKEQLAALENLFWQRKFSEAADLAEKLHQEYSHSFQINFLYVKILKELKRWKETESVLVQLMDSFPDNVSILQEWADVCVHLDKPDEAREYYNKILFLDPFNVSAKEALNRIEAVQKQPAQQQPAEEKTATEEEKDVSRTTNVYHTAAKEEETTAPKAEQKKTKWSISKGDTLPEDTAPEAFLNNIAREIEKSRLKEKTQVERKEVLKEEFERTDDDIKIEIEDFEPGEDKEKENEEEARGLEGLEDFDRVDWDKEFAAEAPPEQPEDVTGGANKEDMDFVTESAAELYLSQGLYEEAIGIYQKIFNLSQDQRFLKKIVEIKAVMIRQKKIHRLSEFLRLIHKKGEQFV
jgi:tetratricopeptide (TPR) repeat protein